MARSGITTRRPSHAEYATRWYDDGYAAAFAGVLPQNAPYPTAGVEAAESPAWWAWMGGWCAGMVAQVSDPVRENQP